MVAFAITKKRYKGRILETMQKGNIGVGFFFLMFRKNRNKFCLSHLKYLW